MTKWNFTMNFRSSLQILLLFSSLTVPSSLRAEAEPKEILQYSYLNHVHHYPDSGNHVNRLKIFDDGTVLFGYWADSPNNTWYMPIQSLEPDELKELKANLLELENAPTKTDIATDRHRRVGLQNFQALLAGLSADGTRFMIRRYSNWRGNTATVTYKDSPAELKVIQMLNKRVSYPLDEDPRYYIAR